MSQHYVYWIHTTNMTNPAQEGYVGVTNNMKRRIAAHFAQLRNQSHINPHFQRAYQIDSDLFVTVLHKDTEEACYAREQELRPSRSIGWNLNEGGTRPPIQIGNQNAKGNRGPRKRVVAPDGTEFDSRKAAAIYYGVDVSTIHNWMKDPSKPWIKRASVNQSNKHNISQYNEKAKRPIATPKGTFNSVKEAADSYGVVHGTINYWRKTKPDQFYLITEE